VKLRTASRVTASNVRVFVDFDGTISLEDTTDLILERFADPAWREVEAEWVAGRIGSRECLARQIDLIRASPAALDALVDDVKLDANFPLFAAMCRGEGIPFTVVSDGLDRVVSAMLVRAGVRAPILANRLEWRGGNRWRLGFPHAREDCRSAAGNCKCAALAGEAFALRILVGDGRSDFCAAESADMVLAKSRLVDHCRTNAIPFAPFEDFAEATGLLREWLAALRRRGVIAAHIEEQVHVSPSS
jgi:2-hydroxy-3-keto-5-methylthiopentenyl-1-phosphate phosphatase